MIQFSIPGEPQPQARHRKGKGGNMYDPSAQAKKYFGILAMQQRPEEPFDFPVAVTIGFFFEAKKGEEGWHTKKPDIDNCIKFALDALNGIYWKDDSFVVQVTATKRYSDKPGIEIAIRDTQI